MKKLQQIGVLLTIYENDNKVRPYAYNDTAEAAADAGQPSNINRKWYALLYKVGLLQIKGGTTSQGADGRNCSLLLCPTQEPTETTYVMNVAFGQYFGLPTGSSYRNWAQYSFPTDSMPSPSSRVSILDGQGRVYTVNYNYYVNYPHSENGMLVTESNYAAASLGILTNALYLDGHASTQQLVTLRDDRNHIFGKIH